MWMIFVLCLIIQLSCECHGATFVPYNITQGEPSTEGIKCVLKSLNTPHVAFGIRDDNSQCLILNQSWIANKTFNPGYTYLEKGIASNSVVPVVQSFVFPDMIGEPNPLVNAERVWPIPGNFGIGARLQLYFTTVSTEWNSVRFRLFDLPTGSSFSIDGLSGKLLASIFISRQDGEVKFQTYSDNHWNSVPPWTPYPFEDGSTYKMTIAAQQDGFQILFDEIERALLPYPGPPDTTKTMVVRGFNHGDVIINNVTFYGV